MTYVIQLFAALSGSIGFAMLFNIKRDKLFVAGLGGFLSWGVYLLAGIWLNSDPIRFFIASITLTFYSEVFAKIKKTPATIFLVTAAIPLIPGGSLYHTMSYAVAGNWEKFATQGTETILLAVAIAIGMLCGLSVLRTVHNVRALCKKISFHGNEP